MRVLDGDATFAINNKKSMYISYTTDKKMTKPQRGSLHVWLDQMAQVLNDAGMPHSYKSKFTGKDIDVDWTMPMLKEMQYKPLLKVMTGKSSTEDQTTIDPSKVADVLIRQYASYGITLPPWPSKN
jgi:hypothetical protein